MTVTHAGIPGMSAHAPAELLSAAGRERPAAAPELAPFPAITPELALVSPELAELARARLPDRPWRSGAAPVEPADLPAPASRGRTRARARRLVLAAAAAALLLGAGMVAFVSTPVSIRGEGPSSFVALTPAGGYVLTPRGSLLADGTGRAIEAFTLPLECGSAPLVLRDVPVPGPSFEFTGTAEGSAVRVRLQATVLDPGRIRGVVVTESATCSPARVTFEARLS
jgi:hypothetical protein